jgi:hypothetical protein
MLKATLEPVKVTASKRTLETGASGTAQKIAGPFAVVPALAVTLRKTIWFQYGVVVVIAAEVSDVGGRLFGYQLVR